MHEVGGVVIAEQGEAEGACAVGEPQGSLRAARILRKAGKVPVFGDLDRVVRSDRVEAADVAGEISRLCSASSPPLPVKETVWPAETVASNSSVAAPESASDPVPDIPPSKSSVPELTSIVPVLVTLGAIVLTPVPPVFSSRPAFLI